MARISFAPSGSAARHAIPREDALHAIRNYRIWIREFDVGRVQGAARPDLFIGSDRAGSKELEVMANWEASGDLFVFHVMALREKTRDTARRIHEARNRR